MQELPVTQIRTFPYTVVNGEGPSLNLPVAHAFVVETTAARTRSLLVEVEPEYGFKIIDGDGHVLADIASGYWPFVKKVIEQMAPIHAPSCAKDCDAEIGAITIHPGEYNG